MGKPRKRKAMVWNSFNRWIVLAEVDSKRTIWRKREYVQRMFQCKCKCGNESIVSYSNLITNDSKSCGCLQKEKAAIQIRKIGWSGDKNPNWRWGIANKNKLLHNSFRNNKQYREWRKLILERDVSCKRCESVIKLQAHHIVNFTKEDTLFELDNWICLCYICHRQFHKQFGFTSNTKEQLEDFIMGYAGA